MKGKYKVIHQKADHRFTLNSFIELTGNIKYFKDIRCLEGISEDGVWWVYETDIVSYLDILKEL